MGPFYCCLLAINLFHCHNLQIKLEEDNRRGMSYQVFISHELVFMVTITRFHDLPLSTYASLRLLSELEKGRAEV